jgi:hypothetical protein
MDLHSYYNQDIEEFVGRYGRPIKRQDHFLVSLTLDIAKNLFRGTKLEETSDGLILVTLDDECVLALGCLPDKEMGAFATRRYGKTYFAVVHHFTIEFIFDLSMSIWKDWKFLSHLKQDLKDISNIITDFIPSNFNNQSEFSNKAIKNISYQCFEQAISFFWLHETAHILLGHLDLIKLDKKLEIIDEFLSVKINDKESARRLINSPIPYQALEIEADRWALDRLFGKLHRKFIATDSLTYLEFINTAIGCTLFPLSLHEYKLLHDESNPTQLSYSKVATHPPLWFRADEVIKAEEKAANKHWFNRTRKDTQLENIRFHQKHLVQLGLAALSQVHPIFGEWLGSVVDLSRQSEADRLINEAYRLFEPWREDLSRYRRSFMKQSSTDS